MDHREQYLEETAFRIDPNYGVFWTKSPHTGDPACLCSICRLPIEETAAPILRMWDEGKPAGEARYHHACIPEILGCREGYLDAERRAQEEGEQEY